MVDLVRSDLLPTNGIDGQPYPHPLESNVVSARLTRSEEGAC